jgi:hypothetical protein
LENDAMYSCRSLPAVTTSDLSEVRLA